MWKVGGIKIVGTRAVTFLGGTAGDSITHFAGRTLPLKYSNFQQIYKKLSQFYKKLNLKKIGAKSRKQCSIRMLVGLHTHYQMHLVSKFTLFFMKFDPT